jgi:glycerol-3-phosphate acyltransferase PlsY
MNPFIAIVAALVGYLLGAISFARLIAGRVAPEKDISSTTFEVSGIDTKMEMTSVSATSVMMHTGPQYGCLTSILDILKVSVPAFIFSRLYPGENYFLLTAAAGVAGHNFPIYYGFKGGRGVSPIFGGLFIIDWLAIPVTVLLSNLIGLGLFRDILFAYTGFTILLIPWMWFRFHDWAYVAYAVAVTLLLFVAMTPELKQYVKFRRSGEMDNIDMQEVMESTHMKYVLRWARRMGWIKEKPKVSPNPDDPPA